MADITDVIAADHEWFRRQFSYLDEAKTVEEMAAIWEPLADRLDIHAEAEEQIFYPALLDKGDEDGEETEDAIADHNKIRDAVADTRRHDVGSEQWRDAVKRARRENGEHLEEEEREGLADFRAHASLDLRHRLAMEWLAFLNEHPLGKPIEVRDKDPDTYIQEHS